MKLRSLLLATAVFAAFGFARQPQVKTGIEVLRDLGFAPLAGKRVGLITNPTGVDSKLKATIDILNEAKNVRLVALFGPEHGVRGNYSAGDKIENAVDSTTGLPMYSLYGTTRKPTPEMLKGIDVLVYDIQDIGARSYTYISTMGLAMEAAADLGIEFVVLDRPNPLGGIKIEGNVVEKGFESFVSQYAVPYVYGLTCGELARMLNEERMLNGGKHCRLTVIPMKGWKRTMTFSDTGLPWVPPSPHIPEVHSSLHYVSLGILGELGVVSEGVGYTIPFQVFAAEWIDAKLFADKLTALRIPGVLFRPLTFKPFYGKHKDKFLNGVQVYFTDYGKAHLMSIQFLLLQVHHQLYPGKNPFALADTSRLKMFDKVCGTDKVRNQFTQRMQYDDIRPLLTRDVETFRAKSRRYYLY